MDYAVTEGSRPFLGIALAKNLSSSPDSNYPCRVGGPQRFRVFSFDLFLLATLIIHSTTHHASCISLSTFAMAAHVYKRPTNVYVAMSGFLATNMSRNFRMRDHTYLPMCISFFSLPWQFVPTAVFSYLSDDRHVAPTIYY